MGKNKTTCYDLNLDMGSSAQPIKPHECSTCGALTTLYFSGGHCEHCLLPCHVVIYYDNTGGAVTADIASDIELMSGYQTAKVLSAESTERVIAGELSRRGYVHDGNQWIQKPKRKS